jgi:hypothetical protein
MAGMTRRRWWWRWTKYPRSYDGGSYRIESRWKEEVVYWEDCRGVVFDAGWGVKPPVLYVPTAAFWDQIVPSWLRGRRDQVIERLREHSGHVVEATEKGYEPGSGGVLELAPVATAEKAQTIATRFLELLPIARYALADVEPREDTRGWMFRCEPSAAIGREPAGATPRPFKLLVRRDTGEPVIDQTDDMSDGA